MMSRSSAGRQMKPGLGSDGEDTEVPESVDIETAEATPEKIRTDRDDANVGNGPAMPRGAVMGGGDQEQFKNTMGDGTNNIRAKNTM